jgi:hypothetical protein
MPAKATTVSAYLEALDAERRAAVQALLTVFRDHLPKGFAEQMIYGMPGFVVPHASYPAGYHCDPKLPLPFINIGAQKNSVSLYHMGLYADPAVTAWFTVAHAQASPKKLDMGKSCVRYKKADDIPLALMAELAGKLTPKAWVALYEGTLKPAGRG